MLSILWGTIHVYGSYGVYISFDATNVRSAQRRTYRSRRRGAKGARVAKRSSRARTCGGGGGGRPGECQVGVLELVREGQARIAMRHSASASEALRERARNVGFEEGRWRWR
jgi:hypothetical protein